MQALGLGTRIDTHTSPLVSRIRLGRCVRFIGRNGTTVNLALGIRLADTLEVPDTDGDSSARTACPPEAQSVRLGECVVL